MPNTYAGALALAGLMAFAAARPAWPADRLEDAKGDTGSAGRTGDLYSLCALYPKPGTCEEVYRRAMDEDTISARAVKAEYEGYVRYLGGEAGLTDADRRYLSQNGIRVPADLGLANQAGLHKVINDPALDPETRVQAANNFLARAVQAELYCSFNRCDGTQAASGTATR